MGLIQKKQEKKSGEIPPEKECIDDRLSKKKQKQKKKMRWAHVETKTVIAMVRPTYFPPFFFFKGG